MVLNPNQNFNHYLQPQLEEDEAIEDLSHLAEEEADEIVDLSDDAVLIEDLPQRAFQAEAPQEQSLEKKERMETFTVTLAGKEFVLPKFMELEWPESDAGDVWAFKFSDLKDEINKVTAKLVTLTNNFNTASEVEKFQLLEEIQKTQNELRESEDFLAKAKKAWAEKNKYYLVDLAKFKNLLEDKKDNITALYRRYDMALDDERLELQDEIDEEEAFLVKLRQEYESYQGLQKDFEGRVKITKPFISETDIKENQDIWKLKVKEKKDSDEVEFKFSSEKELFKVDLEEYVEDNKNVLEMLLKNKITGQEEFDLVLQENFWPQSVKMFFKKGDTKYEFDLAKYQKARYKIFKKINDLQKALRVSRQEKKGFIANDSEAQRLKKIQQEKFATWVNQKRETARWKKEQERVLQDKLEEARQAGNKDAYYSILKQWEIAEENSRRIVYKLDHEFETARKEMVAYTESIDDKFGISKKVKQIERLLNELGKLAKPLYNNPAWRYMNLFPMAVDRAKNSRRL